MTLSYGSQFGYYGLRLNPTLEQVIGSVRKPLRIPLPDRRAKYFALSPYRALILDAQQQANDYEGATLDYRTSGAHLPEAAAALRPSDAGEDRSFRRIDEHHKSLALQSAYETAYKTMAQERKGRTQQQHEEVLRAQHGPIRMNPVIEAHHRSLKESGVLHNMPGIHLQPQPKKYPAPPQLFVAAGQPQYEEFPSYEMLNLGVPENLLMAHPDREQNLTYERIRDLVIQPTWSS
jgi:hypothetical protein